MVAAIVLAILAVIPFAPTLGNAFVNWGDEAELVHNPNYRGFTAQHLAWMFTANHMGHYQPLTWLTLAMDHEIWGMDVVGYRIQTLVWHGLCTMLAFAVILRLIQAAHGWRADEPGGGWPFFGMLIAAAIGTLLFAVHPLRVESIAWATERRSTVSGFFFLAAVLAYLRYARQDVEARDRPSVWGRSGPWLPSSRAYWLAVVFMLLSLMAKEFSMTLPAVLLILDVYPLRRLTGQEMGRLANGEARRLVIEKWPFFALTLLWVAIASWSVAASGVAKTLSDHGPLERLAQAFFGLWLYVSKTFWPVGLSPLYSIPLEFDPLAWRFVGSAIGVVVVTAVLVLLRKRWPAALTAWCGLAVIVSPVLGLVQTGNQMAADRYMYLPGVGVGAAAAGLFLLLLNAKAARVNAARVGAITLIALLLVVALAWRTWEQALVWRDSDRLWTHALMVDPECPIATLNLGVSQVDAGKVESGSKLIERAVEMNPDNPNARYSLGVIRAQQGRVEEAIEAFEAALRLQPEFSIAKKRLEELGNQRR